MKITDRQLYNAAPIAENVIYSLLKNSAGKPHTFSELFENNIQKIIESKYPESPIHHSRLTPKRAFGIIAIIVLLAGLTITANAMTDGALLRYIQNISFGYSNGPHSTFVYGETDGLSLDDFPEGTTRTEVTYSDGKYYLNEKEEIPLNRIIFLNPTTYISNGDKIEILLLP